MAMFHLFFLKKCLYQKSTATQHGCECELQQCFLIYDYQKLAGSCLHHNNLKLHLMSTSH